MDGTKTSLPLVNNGTYHADSFVLSSFVYIGGIPAFSEASSFIKNNNLHYLASKRLWPLGLKRSLKIHIKNQFSKVNQYHSPLFTIFFAPFSSFSDFSGCISDNLRIASGLVVKVAQIIRSQGVDLSGCPLTFDEVKPCSEPSYDLLSPIVEGLKVTFFVDIGLEAFTGVMAIHNYLYS